MSLETGTYIQDLVVTNPVGTDQKKQGDDHIRLIKTVLKNTFPGATRAFPVPGTSVETANFSVVAGDQNTTFLVDTNAGAVTATLPALTSADAGWECSFIKTNTDVDPLFIAPASGTIQSGDLSGLAKTRRAVPGVKTRVFWTGTAWIAERPLGAPLNSTIPYHGSALPVGYEWPNGQTLASASTSYPDFYARNGSSGVVVDLRGRLPVGKDDMGGSAAGRVTTAGSGVDGATLGAVGGAQNVTLTEAKLPAHTHGAGTLAADSGGAHTHNMQFSLGTNPGSGGVPAGLDTANGSVIATASNGAHVHTISGASASTGGGEAQGVMPPSLICNHLLVVE